MKIDDYATIEMCRNICFYTDQGKTLDEASELVTSKTSPAQQLVFALNIGEVLRAKGWQISNTNVLLAIREIAYG